MELDVYNDIICAGWPRVKGKSGDEFLQRLIRSTKTMNRHEFNKYWLLDLVPNLAEEHIALYQSRIQHRLTKNEKLHTLPDSTSIILAYKTQRDPSDHKKKKGFWFSSWYMGQNLEEATSTAKRKIKTFKLLGFRVRFVHGKGFDPGTSDWKIGYWKPVWRKQWSSEGGPYCGESVEEVDS